MSFPQIINCDNFMLKAATDVDKASEFAEIVANNQDEFRFLSHTSKILTAEKAVAEIKHFKGMWANNGNMFFYFIHSLSDKIIGSVGIKIRDDRHTAEICYWLDKKATGKGYVTKAVELVEKSVFATGCHRIEILCNENNVRSVKVAKRLNYHADGILRDAEYLNGKYHNVVVFSKLVTD